MHNLKTLKLLAKGRLIKTFLPSKRKITDYFIEVAYKRFNPEDIKVIFDIGSRDRMESVELHNHFPNAKVYAFECNPLMIPVAKENTKSFSRITVVPKAVNEYDGTCTFFPIDTNDPDVGNPGASSIFETSEDFKMEQKKIEVPCTRLDTFCSENNIDGIDLVWMDLQGAELLALKSMGEKLKTIKLIQSEVEFQEMFKGQDLFPEINDFFISNEFTLLDPKRIAISQAKDSFTDVMYSGPSEK
jgi:FkbM family methyltransferase